MSCGTSPMKMPPIRGFRAEELSGVMPGMGGCGCGCAAEAEEVTGWMPGTGSATRVHGVARHPGVSSSLSTPSIFGGTWRDPDARHGRVGALDPSEGGSAADLREAETKNDAVDDLRARALADFEEWKLTACTLSPPDESEWGACASLIDGNASDCNYKACDRTVSLTDIAGMLDKDSLLADYDSPIDFDDRRDTVTECEFELTTIIRAGWAMLAENEDLVRWAMCWTFGDHRFWALPTEVQIVIKDGTKSDLSTAPMETKSERSITIFGYELEFRERHIIVYAGHDYWKTAIAMWCCERTPDRACVAVDVAITLFHELTHYFEFAGSDPDPDIKCYSSYVAHSVFAWAMYRRFGALSKDWYTESVTGGTVESPPCCADVGDSIVFAQMWPDVLSNECGAEEFADCDKSPSACGEAPCS